MKKNIKKTVLLVSIIALFIIIKFTNVGQLIDLSRITESRDLLLNQVEQYYIPTTVIFILVYILTVALSVPGATLLTITGGFLFGPVFAPIYINVGATIGALIIFLITRYLLGNSVQQKYEPQLKKFNNELDKNGSNYLLTLRFIPLFPFFLINILAGLTNVSAKKFIWTTSVGIIPGSIIYAYLGYAGTTTVVEGPLLSKEVIIAFVLLGLLSLVPVIVKKIKGKKDV
ncbi:MAG: TVP38/TMEM64 family protein [Spirochaetaceae bacterium]